MRPESCGNSINLSPSGSRADGVSLRSNSKSRFCSSGGSFRNFARRWRKLRTRSETSCLQGVRCGERAEDAAAAPSRRSGSNPRSRLTATGRASGVLPGAASAGVRAGSKETEAGSLTAVSSGISAAALPTVGEGPRPCSAPWVAGLAGRAASWRALRAEDWRRTCCIV